MNIYIGCGENCISCTSQTVCTKCYDSYFLYQANCYSPCPTGCYGDTSSTPNSCLGNN